MPSGASLTRFWLLVRIARSGLKYSMRMRSTQPTWRENAKVAGGPHRVDYSVCPSL